jgi:predicted nuclease of predicted toxin-antitoxin system
VNLRLLLDEHISPSLTAKLAELGVFAQAVAHVGLSGQPDRLVWAFASQHEMAVVTTNAADFLDLLEDAELHPGLILLRESGLHREQQWQRLEPAIRFIQSQYDADYLVNKVIDILSPGEFRILEVPKL